MSMLAKFLLIVYIGKYLSIDDLGEYGLFVTTITIAIYFLGMDFYTYNTREILAKGKDDRLPLIRDQFIFHLVVYVVVLPLMLSVFAMGIINIEYIIYFYLILVFEHLSQELYRLYTTLQKPIFANTLLFLRTGLWVYVIIVFWHFHIPNTTNLKTIWYGWSIGSFISILIGISYIFKEYNFYKLKKNINWSWIKQGVKVSIPLFIGTLAYKIIEFCDRYMIDYYMTKADVGIYTFFGGIANSINIIVFTTVVMIYYPILISLYQHSKTLEYENELRSFTFKTILVSFIVAIAIIFLVFPILDFMDKNNLKEHIHILYLLVIANILLNITLVPHYILYVMKKDLIIRNSSMIGAILNILLNLVLIQYYGISGAAIATIFSFTAIGILKYTSSRKYRNDSF